MRTPAAGRSASKPSLGFDRRDDSFEVEACTPAGFGDRLGRRGFVRYARLTRAREYQIDRVDVNLSPVRFGPLLIAWRIECASFEPTQPQRVR
jgi:hypothetical protein